MNYQESTTTQRIFLLAERSLKGKHGSGHGRSAKSESDCCLQRIAACYLGFENPGQSAHRELNTPNVEIFFRMAYDRWK